MRLLSSIFLLSLALTSCNKSGDPAMQAKSDSLLAKQQDSIRRANDPIVHTANPNGVQSEVRYKPTERDSILRLPKAQRPSNPVEALKAYFGPPKPGTLPVFPMHLMPAENVTLGEANDSVAALSFTAGHTKMRVLVLMERIHNNADSAWIVKSVEEQPPAR